MRPIVNLAVRSEFSFRQTYGKLNEKYIQDFSYGQPAFGVADLNNTFSHVYLAKACESIKKKTGRYIKPIYGVRLEVLQDPRARERGICGPIYLFIARSQSGLHELNKLVKTAWDNFYYKPMVGWDDVNELTDQVVVISDNIESEDVRLDYLALTPSTPFMLMGLDKPKVYINNNNFGFAEDRKSYQLIAGSQKRADGYVYKFETRRCMQHILCAEEFDRIWHCDEAILNTHEIAESCEVELPKAHMVKYKGDKNLTTLCELGAKRKGIDIKEGEYAERFEREMDLIYKKDYVDYFLIVADMITKAKKKMFVGPARGSAAGSLVCYLIGITEVDPIRFGLLFERFIDINRNDLPDIDVDFPDERRQEVIKDLFKTHGKENVCHIANINEYAAKSAIDEVGIALRISKYEIDLLKDSIVDRSGGDARAAMSVQDTLEGTDTGKNFMNKYPSMKYAGKLQTHSTHMGKHAAGIIVCNDEITKFGGVNSREGSIMMDKKGAEYLNLLKIDCLGLRNLSILQECAKLIGMDYMDYYTMPLDDKKTYEIFKNMRLNGIFQFEGQAMRLLCSKMGVEHFDDIVVITALARPGPLQSGGADKFTKRRVGAEKVEYICKHPEFIKCTEGTYGIIVYQEQLMHLCRSCGNMSWEDVSEIRKAASKTLGKEFFDQYRQKFLTGAKENEIDDHEAVTMWENMMTFGCLSGDTIIQMPCSNQYSPKQITIAELYENKGLCKPSDDWDNYQQQKERGLSKIWMYDFEREACFPTRPIEIVRSGIKETFELRTENKSIRATKDHKFLTKDGWVTLGDLKIGDEIVILGKSISNQRRERQRKHEDDSWRFNKRKPYDGRSTEFEINRNKLIEKNPYCAVCGKDWEETHHKDGDRSNNEIENIELLCRKHHKERHKDMGDRSPYPHMNGKKISLEKIISISNNKMEMTYDICMPDPNNNFEANGFIVHNSWGMNKSHTVSYGYISYWCAFMKAHHPIEFVLANLRHAASNEAALKILRDAYENDGIEYIPVDPDESEIDWSIKDGKLVGGLQNIDGVGPKTAIEIIEAREGKRKLGAGVIRKLLNPITPFDTIYPCRDKWGKIYDNPAHYGLNFAPTFINDVNAEGEYVIIGKIMRRDVRDLNEYNELVKRGGKRYNENNKSLKLTIEDDTGQINCSISRFNFDKCQGTMLAETLIEGSSWVIIKGELREGWRVIHVSQIFDLKNLED